MAKKKEGKSLRQRMKSRQSALDRIMGQMPYQEKKKPGAKKVGDK